MISGKDKIVKKFKDILVNYEERDTYFCELKDNKNLLKYDDSVKVAREEDAERVHELIGTIDEFFIQENIDEMRDKIKDSSKIVYYIENDENEMT